MFVSSLSVNEKQTATALYDTRHISAGNIHAPLYSFSVPLINLEAGNYCNDNIYQSLNESVDWHRIVVRIVVKSVVKQMVIYEQND